MFLVSDIGGTNTRLALVEDARPIKIIQETTYPSAEEKDLSSIIIKFLNEHKAQVDKASVAIAGPVQDGKCKATNLPWVVDAKDLATKTKIKTVHLLNDLLANACGIKALDDSQFITINKGKSQDGNGCLISAGTGLGQAGMVWDGKQHHPFASEGGHVDFAPKNEREFKLLCFMEKKYGRISYERVLSGPGLFELYEFMTQEEGQKASAELLDALKKESDGSKVITELGLQGDPLCEQVLDWFISFYGAEAGNLALKFLSVWGVYIGGGIAPRIAEKMANGSFMKAFRNKGRFEPILSNIPVRLITNDRTALLGAAEYGLSKG